MRRFLVRTDCLRDVATRFLSASMFSLAVGGLRRSLRERRACVRKPGFGAPRDDQERRWPLTLIRRFRGSAYMSRLLANRARPYAHMHSAAAHMLPHRRHMSLYSACRFQLLANRVGPYAHTPSAGPNNLAHRS